MLLLSLLDFSRQTLYAMLHTDAGEAGKFESPDGPDGLVKVGGKANTPPFMVSQPAGAGEDAGGGEIESLLLRRRGR